MAETTKIAWCDATVNFWWGCTKVSPACTACYAETWAARFGVGWGPGAPRRKTAGAVALAHKLQRKAKKLGRKLLVFSISMGDFFDDEVPPEWRAEAWETIRACPDLIFLLLTKRPENARAMLPADWGAGYTNVWLGFTAESQEWLDKRAAIALQIPAALWFVSAEPLLEVVDLGLDAATCPCCPRWASRWIRVKRPVGPDLPELFGERAATYVADAGVYRAESNPHGALSVRTPGGLLGVKPAEFDVLPQRIGWVIVGGESAQGKRDARPFNVGWARSIVRQCGIARTPCFVKQMGDAPQHEVLDWFDVPEPRPLPLATRAGTDPSEWPPDLAGVREFPMGLHAGGAS